MTEAGLVMGELPKQPQPLCPCAAEGDFYLRSQLKSRVILVTVAIKCPCTQVLQFKFSEQRRQSIGLRSRGKEGRKDRPSWVLVAPWISMPLAVLGRKNSRE